MGGLVFGHSIKEPQKEALFESCRVDSIVAEFAKETAVSLIGREVDTA